MTGSSHLTRRALLRATMLTSVAGLAGCSTDESESTTPTPQDASVFDSVAVEGNFLTVTLGDTQEVSAVNLIAPDGTLYRSQEVAAGTETIQFRLIELGRSQSTHYPPGEYELVADAGDGVVASQTVSLTPDLRIREIRQYDGSESPLDETRLAVVVENVGTAPTWIYDIAYRNAPYQEANDEVGSRRDISRLLKPDKIDDLILRPGSEKEYVPSEQPLRFNNDGTAVCSDTIEMRVILGTAANSPVEKQIEVTVSGSSNELGLERGYSCENVSVEMLSSNHNDTENGGT